MLYPVLLMILFALLQELRVHYHQISGYGFLPQGDAPDLPSLQRRPPLVYIIPYPTYINKEPVFADKLLILDAQRLHGLYTYAASLTERTINIPYPCAINVAELYAICDFIAYIHEQSTNHIIIWPENTTVQINSDSETCIKMFSNEYYG